MGVPQIFQFKEVVYLTSDTPWVGGKPIIFSQELVNLKSLFSQPNAQAT
jgi:hypothetical protein